MKIRRISMKKYVLAGMAVLLLLTGCSKGVPTSNDRKEISAYSLPETMIVVATERNRYTKVYTDQIWEVSIGEDGMDFQTYIVNEVRRFMEEMKIMNLLAKEKEITLTGVEQDKVSKIAQEYFQGLTKADIEYMGITQEDVKKLYTEYRVANKLVDELTKQVDLEVSDNEAKVIRVAQIKVRGEDEAQAALEKVTAEGADFLTVARDQSSVTSVERQVGKGTESSEYESAAFSLAEGEISGVISVPDDGFYILKCLDDYDEKATQEHKKQISAERKSEAFYKEYNQFLEENPMVFSDSIWDEIHFSKDDQTTTTNFFELYRQVFPD